jgi:hypothetical protein
MIVIKSLISFALTRQSGQSKQIRTPCIKDRTFELAKNFISIEHYFSFLFKFRSSYRIDMKIKIFFD